ncbi:MAG: hypothetical protein IOD12_12015 [Silvanigrellales bacterium]|nr:hypothetical protein [Silvanigrellales bacterium]
MIPLSRRLQARPRTCFFVCILVWLVSSSCSRPPADEGVPWKAPTGQQREDVSFQGSLTAERVRLPNPLGGETQNGGYGVRLESGVVVSLDLYLRSSHLDPDLSKDEPDALTQEERDLLRRSLAIFEADVVSIVERKMSALRRLVGVEKMPLDVAFVVSRAGAYTWLELDGLSCLDVNDDRSPVPNKVQLAYREGRWIRFCGDSQKLASSQLAALIVHEMLYAALVDKSWVAELTGFLFSQDFARYESPARAEFLDLVRNVSSQVTTEGLSVSLARGRALDPSVPVEGATTGNDKACSGVATSFRKEGSLLEEVRQVAIWISEAGCNESLLRMSNANPALLEFNNAQIELHGEQVGKVTAKGDLVELCSGPASGLCVVRLDDVARSATVVKLLGDSSLGEAIRQGNRSRVAWFIAQGWDPRDPVPGSGIPPLSQAIDGGAPVEFLTWLIAQGAGVDQESSNAGDYVCPARPLTVAAWKLRLDALNVLLDAGAQLDFRVQYTPTGSSPFDCFTRSTLPFLEVIAGTKFKSVLRAVVAHPSFDPARVSKALNSVVPSLLPDANLGAVEILTRRGFVLSVDVLAGLSPISFSIYAKIASSLMSARHVVEDSFKNKVFDGRAGVRSCVQPSLVTSSRVDALFSRLVRNEDSVSVSLFDIVSIFGAPQPVSWTLPADDCLGFALLDAAPTAWELALFQTDFDLDAGDPRALNGRGFAISTSHILALAIAQAPDAVWSEDWKSYSWSRKQIEEALRVAKRGATSPMVKELEAKLAQDGGGL